MVLRDDAAEADVVSVDLRVLGSHVDDVAVVAARRDLCARHHAGGDTCQVAVVVVVAGRDDVAAVRAARDGSLGFAHDASGYGLGLHARGNRTRVNALFNRRGGIRDDAGDAAAMLVGRFGADDVAGDCTRVGARSELALPADRLRVGFRGHRADDAAHARRTDRRGVEVAAVQAAAQDDADVVRYVSDDAAQIGVLVHGTRDRLDSGRIPAVDIVDGAGVVAVGGACDAAYLKHAIAVRALVDADGSVVGAGGVGGGV